MASITGTAKTVSGIEYTPTLIVNMVTNNTKSAYVTYNASIQLVARNTSSTTRSASVTIETVHNGPAPSGAAVRYSTTISVRVSANSSQTYARNYNFIVSKDTSSQSITFTSSSATYFTNSLSIKMTTPALTKFTVTYDGGGIAANRTQQVYYGYTTTPPTLGATGFTLYDWRSSTLLRSVDFETRKITDTTTFYSIWIEHQYMIVFNPNGGESILNNKLLYYRDTYILPSEGVGKVGHHLSSWNTLADGSGTSYSLSQEVSQLIATNGGTITLYAIWEENG